MPRPRILLVDDDPAVRSSIAFALEVEGFEVLAYDSAETVLADPAPGNWCCLVLDHRLPGADGLELLRELRARGVQAPAILITTSPVLRLRERVCEAGADLIEKPLLSNALAAAIGSAVTRPGRPRAMNPTPAPRRAGAAPARRD